MNKWIVFQLLNHVWLFETSWTAAHQASLSSTISWSLLKFMSIESVMPSNHLILCHPPLLLPSVFPSIRAFPNDTFQLYVAHNTRISILSGGSPQAPCHQTQVGDRFLDWSFWGPWVHSLWQYLQGRCWGRGERRLQVITRGIGRWTGENLI